MSSEQNAISESQSGNEEELLSTSSVSQEGVIAGAYLAQISDMEAMQRDEAVPTYIVGGEKFSPEALRSFDIPQLYENMQLLGITAEQKQQAGEIAEDTSLIKAAALHNGFLENEKTIATAAKVFALTSELAGPGELELETAPEDAGLFARLNTSVARRMSRVQTGATALMGALALAVGLSAVAPPVYANGLPDFSAAEANVAEGSASNAAAREKARAKLYRDIGAKHEDTRAKIADSHEVQRDKVTVQFEAKRIRFNQTYLRDKEELYRRKTSETDIARFERVTTENFKLLAQQRDAALSAEARKAELAKKHDVGAEHREKKNVDITLDQ